MPRAAIVDVDGTLVDTNYQHAVAWQRALRRHRYVVPAWRIHRHIGMGGDQLVAAVAGEEAEERCGDEVRDAEGELYGELIDEVVPLEGARELIVALGERFDSVVLASSAKEGEVDHYLDLLEAREIADAWTTSADVEATKPEPDLVHAALEKAGTGEGMMIGDTTWDVEAAGRAGLPSVAVLTGGFGAAELLEAGAAAVFESVAELGRKVDRLEEIAR
ncbi:MAG TPA: HAD family hydrolase [Candidatus Limnocylindria bacterium]|nr:HAD family hydrolase [Candidatus Limnocylindria bacterium]